MMDDFFGGLCLVLFVLWCIGVFDSTLQTPLTVFAVKDAIVKCEPNGGLATVQSKDTSKTPSLNYTAICVNGAVISSPDKK